jgi:tetratricopeptide (TPR) repeat protein
LARIKKQNAARTDASRWHFALIALAFAVVTAIVFGPAISAPFDADDGPSIANNASIRQLWPATVPLSPPSLGIAVSGRPIANYSFAIDYALNRAFDVDPSSTTVYHETNMLLHVVNALLLFLLIRRTIRFGQIDDEWRDRAERVALIAAALWLVHPIQTEAVDYLSQRTELLVSFFYLTTLYAASRAWLGARATTRTTASWMGVAVVASALGMAAKEVMVTAPIVVLLYDRAFVSTSWQAVFGDGRRRGFYVALFATLAISLALVANGARSATAGFGRGMSSYEYFYTQCWAVAHYLRLIVWPAPLLYSYGRQPVHGAAPLVGGVVLVALAVLSIFAWRRNEWRWAGFSGAFFFLLLAPSSSVVPIVTEVAAERRVYLAAAAVLLLAAVGAEALVRRLASSRAVLAGVAIVGLALSVTAFQRSAMYNDPGELWRHVVAHRPNDARALIGVANADMRRTPPQYDEADTSLRRATAIDSTLIQARTYRATIAIRQSRFVDAETLLVHALRIDSLDQDATANLGELYLAQNRAREAIPLLAKVARIFPTVDAYKNLGLAYLVAGRLDSAVVPLQLALRINPNDADAMHTLAGALIEAGRGADALPILEHARQRDPSSAELLAMSSLAAAEARQVDDAIRFGSSALSQIGTHEDADVDLFLGRAMELSGKLPDAGRLYARAAGLRPRDPQAPTRLATVAAALGDRAKALQILKEVLSGVPDYGPARAEMNRLTAR